MRIAMESNVHLINDNVVRAKLRF